MTSSLSNEVRSLHGCWTCRLRRKKCDENQPSCMTCNSLDLECHGYGPKPEWMDRGNLQKEQGLRIKRLVSQARSTRRRQRSLQMASPSQDLELGLNSNSLSSDQPVSSAAISVPSRNHAPVELEEPLIFSDDLGINMLPMTLDTTTFDPSLYSLEPDQRLFDIMVANENEDSDPGSSLPDSSGTQYLSTFLWPTTHDADSMNQGDTNLWESPRSGAYSERNPRDESHQACVPSPPTPFPPWFVDPNKITLQGSDTEDNLLMYYLDLVFYIQYPFYQSGGGSGRGWLLSILRRVKSAYHATLALSEYHRLSILPCQETANARFDRLRLKGGHYDLAVREMQAYIGESHTRSKNSGIIYSVEALTCILQLLFWELFSGGADNWRMHLCAAANLVPMLQEKNAASSGFNNAAVDFLLGSFILFDVIACVSTRSSPFLALDHKAVLETSGINLQNLIGCENWAIVLILEISQLDLWRKKSEKAHKLSIPDLAKRGSQIETQLNRSLHDLKALMNTPSGKIKYEMTNIFALSALTYLHVVLSGPHSELPEIKESVSKTITAFQSLSDARLLRNLVWPFCITGCFAVEAQHSFFRRLVSAAEITSSTLGTCVAALKIIEECWKEREFYPCSFDWVAAMNKQCHLVLLW